MIYVGDAFRDQSGNVKIIARIDGSLILEATDGSKYSIFNVMRHRDDILKHLELIGLLSNRIKELETTMYGESRDPKKANPQDSKIVREIINEIYDFFGYNALISSLLSKYRVPREIHEMCPICGPNRAENDRFDYCVCPPDSKKAA